MACGPSRSTQIHLFPFSIFQVQSFRWNWAALWRIWPQEKNPSKFFCFWRRQQNQRPNQCLQWTPSVSRNLWNSPFGLLPLCPTFRSTSRSVCNKTGFINPNGQWVKQCWKHAHCHWNRKESRSLYERPSLGSREWLSKTYVRGGSNAKSKCQEMASESILGEILSLLGDVSREVSLVVPKKSHFEL